MKRSEKVYTKGELQICKSKLQKYQNFATKTQIDGGGGFKSHIMECAPAANKNKLDVA